MSVRVGMRHREMLDAMRQHDGRAALIGLRWYVGERVFVEKLGRDLVTMQLATDVSPWGHEQQRIELTLRGQDEARA